MVYLRVEVYIMPFYKKPEAHETPADGIIILKRREIMKNIRKLFQYLYFYSQLFL